MLISLPQKPQVKAYDMDHPPKRLINNSAFMLVITNFVVTCNKDIMHRTTRREAKLWNWIFKHSVRYWYQKFVWWRATQFQKADRKMEDISSLESRGQSFRRPTPPSALSTGHVETPKLLDMVKNEWIFYVLGLFNTINVYGDEPRHYGKNLFAHSLLSRERNSSFISMSTCKRI